MGRFRGPELGRRNAEMISDPTAYSAFSHKKEMEQREYDLSKLDMAMYEVKSILARYGFRLESRIKVKSRRSGMIYE